MAHQPRKLYRNSYYPDGTARDYGDVGPYGPGFVRHPRTEEERDCPYCLHWLKKYKTCKYRSCVVFVD